MNKTYEEIINLTFYSQDFGEIISIKEYFRELLLTLWEEDEGFSGKRPFGNSGWKDDIFKCLIHNDIIDGEIDDDGYLEDCDEQLGDKIIQDCIKYIFNK